MAKIALDDEDKDKLATFLGQNRLVRNMIDALADLSKEFGKSEMLMWNHLRAKYDLPTGVRYKLNWADQVIETIE